MVWNELRQAIVGFVRTAMSLEELTLESLMVPPSPEKGDFAFPCFTLAKTLKKSPNAIAVEIAEKINKAGHALLESVQADGGYVNFSLRGEYLAQQLFDSFAEEGTKFGSSLACQTTKVMIEYSQPNTHKEFHVGHLRNVVIGNAMVQLSRNSGCWVSAVNYIGDFGMDVAKCLWCLKKYHANEVPPKGKEGRWLGKIYAEASKKLEENPELKEEVNTVLALLDARDPQWFPLFLETKEWSMQGFRAIYQELETVFDDWFYESELKDEGKEIVQQLVEQGIAKKSEGATIVDLTAHGLDVFLILKSDGNPLYATFDLALAYEKFRRHEVEESIIVTDVRQSFYFKQLFKVLELAGFKKKLRHIGYEFVRLPEGAMASRHGRVVLYEDVRDQVMEVAQEETLKRHPAWDVQKVHTTAHAIALAAIKFDILRHDPGTVIVFDAKKAVSFEGFTGPYVQYVYARVQSIFRKKMKEVPAFPYIDPLADASLLTAPEEKQLLMQLAQFPVVIEQARAQCNPSLLCRYVYETARAFSAFYEACLVLADDPALAGARLSLCSMVGHTLQKGLSLLGIRVVEEM